MRFFRRLGDAKQQAVTEEWKNMSDKDKNAFTKNIKDLGALKLKLLTREVKWKDVAPPFGLDVVLKEVRKSKPKPVPKVSNVLQSPCVRTRSSQQSPDMTVESTPAAAVARVAVVSDPPPAEPLPNDENLETLENLEALALSGMRLAPAQLAGEYCGLASPAPLRIEVGGEAKKRARHDTKRRIGVNAETLDQQQGDSTANSAVERAMASLAKASDTVYYPNRMANLPSRTLVMIDVNQVVGKTASGGKIGQGNVTSTKTMVTITGVTDVDELVALMKDVGAALKHDNADNKTHQLQMIYRAAFCENTGMATPRPIRILGNEF
jgi:hypothetical protein